MKLPFMLEMVDLELVAKGKLGNLLLHLVIVLRDPLQDVLDELALCVTDGDGELVDLELVAKGKVGHFGGTKNGTSGARIKILRPLL